MPRPTALTQLFIFFSILSFGASATELKVKTPEDIEIKLGARLHLLASISDDERLSDRDELDFQIRRGRLRFSANIDKWITVAIQTETLGQNDKLGSDAGVIDAYVHFKPSQPLQLVIGQHMAPALRQNVTSSGSMLAIDRPAINFKSLTWGTRTLAGFSRRTQNETDSGLRGETDVRDVGMTLFGAKSSSETLHYTYYAGIYEGAQTALSNRFTGRFQINFGDAEDKYFNASTYYGKKNTIALGISFDSQQDVARDFQSGDSLNYSLQSVDFFAEKTLGQFPITFETAYINMDLDGADFLADQDQKIINNTKAKGIASEGSGYYIQSGILFGNWQPWIGTEEWSSNEDNKLGSFQNFRIGVTYIINKYANIKAGIEYWDDKSNNPDTQNDFATFTSGFFVTF